MKTRTINIIGYVIYMIITLGLLTFLFMMRDQFNWVAGGLREIFTYSISAFSIVFLLIIIVKFAKNKNRTTLIFGAIGIIPLLLAIPFFKSPILSPQKELTEEIIQIDLEYVAWACYCPRWIVPEDVEAAAENDSLCMHVEPGFDSIVIPDSLLYSGNVFKFKGQFYKEKQYGKDIEDGGLAKMFRYTEFKLIDTVGIWTKKIIDDMNYEFQQ